MPKNVSTILINAPLHKVWDALTEPELVKKWQYGSKLLTDWQPGTGIRFITEWDGKIFEQWGKVIEVDPGRLLRYSLFAPRPGLEDKPEHYFIMNYILTEQGEQTKLEIIQEDDRPGVVQEDPQGEENPILQSLKTLVEGN